MYITLITRRGFFSQDTRTFRRDKVKVLEHTQVDGGTTSAFSPMGDYYKIETPNGEIVEGREEINYGSVAYTSGG